MGAHGAHFKMRRFVGPTRLVVQLSLPSLALPIRANDPCLACDNGHTGENGHKGLMPGVTGRMPIVTRHARSSTTCHAASGRLLHSSFDFQRYNLGTLTLLGTPRGTTRASVHASPHAPGRRHVRVYTADALYIHNTAHQFLLVRARARTTCLAARARAPAARVVASITRTHAALRLQLLRLCRHLVAAGARARCRAAELWIQLSRAVHPSGGRSSVCTKSLVPAVPPRPSLPARPSSSRALAERQVQKPASVLTPPKKCLQDVQELASFMAAPAGAGPLGRFHTSLQLHGV
eukprot:COSAG02_NODE_1443_length_12584_cov_2.587425_11_plen_292_part_00